jgi:hypothetical protein
MSKDAAMEDCMENSQSGYGAVDRVHAFAGKATTETVRYLTEDCMEESFDMKL